MKLRQTVVSLTYLVLPLTAAFAQAFDCGSDGSDGALLVNSTTGDVSIPLPPDGILNYTTIDIADGALVTFVRNAGNTPVYMLATGAVSIDGLIDISGKEGIGPSGGMGGPGGYNGGNGATADLPAGYGQGPGGSMPGPYLDEFSPPPGNGQFLYGNYSNSLLMPLVGGSGSGGATDAPFGGGGGGGAILIASNTEIILGDYGSIYAKGGMSERADYYEPYEKYTYASGGAVRLVAPSISNLGSFTFDVDYASPGRIRLDALDFHGLDQMYLYPSEALSVGANMQVFPPNKPQLKITRIGDNVITDSSPTVHFLPPGTGMVDIDVEVVGINSRFDVNLVITPENGDKITTMAPFDPSVSPTVTFSDVMVPTGIPFRVDAWSN